jgi:hypothetical protein
MRLNTIARIIENSRRLTEQDTDGWLWRRWTDNRNGKSYSVEYTSTEYEDARTVMIHRNNGRNYIEKGE